MIRFIFRLAGMTALSVATIMAVLDVKRSLGASAPIFTALGDSWRFAFPTIVPDVGPDGPVLWHRAFEAIMGLPGFAVFVGIAIVLLFAGRRTSRTASRFAA